MLKGSYFLVLSIQRNICGTKFAFGPVSKLAKRGAVAFESLVSVIGRGVHPGIGLILFPHICWACCIPFEAYTWWSLVIWPRPPH